MTASLGGAVDFGEAFVARRGDVRGAWLNAALIMVNTAKIELWLAGYDVDLDDRKPIETTKLFGTGHRRRWQPNDSLGSALKRYWRNRSRSGEISASEASSRQARLGMLLLHEMPAFLRETAEASAEYHRIPDEVRSQSIADWYRMHPQHVETSVQRVDTLRSRLWDGLKRAWSWIKGLIRDAFDAARKFARESPGGLSTDQLH